MIAVAEVDPHLSGQCLAGHVGIEERHLGGVGVHGLGLTHQHGHQIDDRAKQLGDLGHPVAHGRARDVHTVACEDAFQAMQRQMVGVFAGSELR